MKKSKVDTILIEQTKRRRTIILFLLAIFTFSILTAFFFLVHIDKNKKQYASYDETSNIDYKVYLKENNFFQNEFLGKDSEIISSLIDYINADFNYEISLKDMQVNFKYSYRIEAEVNVRGKNNSLYKFSEELLSLQDKTSNSKSNVVIDEKVKIDYNYYNDIVESFVKTYGLSDASSVLSVNMYINVLGACEDFENETNEQKVISLEIPLTTKTMNIDISSNLVEEKDNIMLCNDSKTYIFLIVAGVLLFVSIVYLILMIKYIIKTRTPEDIYQKELKKILNNYHAYIQKINNDFDLSDYQKLKVDTFSDMLELRDTIQQPILMVENQKKTSVFFIIPSNKILYMYSIRVCDIKKSMNLK